MSRVLLHHHLHKCEMPDIQQWDLHSSLKDKVVSFIYILHFVIVKFVYHLNFIIVTSLYQPVTCKARVRNICIDGIVLSWDPGYVDLQTSVLSGPSTGVTCTVGPQLGGHETDGQGQDNCNGLCCHFINMLNFLIFQWILKSKMCN